MTKLTISLIYFILIKILQTLIYALNHVTILLSLFNAVSINNIELEKVGDLTIRLTKETVKTKGS